MAHTNEVNNNNYIQKLSLRIPDAMVSVRTRSYVVRRNRTVIGYS